MANKRLRNLTASQLRLILLGSMALLLIITVGVFLYFRSELINYAQQVQNDNAKATASSSDINTLKQLKDQLAKDQDAVARTKSIVADSQYYQYQNQIITDINEYAKQAGVSLSGFTFNEASTTPSAAASGSAPAGAAGAAAAPGAPGAAAAPGASTGGLKSVSVLVGLKSPLDYKALMQFIHYIEVNLTKMQISGISLAKAQNSKTQVSADQLNIQVYTR